MSKLQKPSRLGATPGKLTLMAVLAVILVVVVAVQFGSESEARRTCERESGGEDQTPSPQPKAAAQDVPRRQKPGRARDTSSPWPGLELSDVLAYDPFATPAPFSRHQHAAKTTRDDAQEEEASALQEELARMRAEQDRFLEQLHKEGVRAVVGNAHHGHAALVGSETVRPGDVLGGFRVVKIDPDGVVLERMPGTSRETTPQ